MKTKISIPPRKPAKIQRLDCDRFIPQSILSQQYLILSQELRDYTPKRDSFTQRQIFLQKNLGIIDKENQTCNILHFNSKPKVCSQNSQKSFFGFSQSTPQIKASKILDYQLNLFMYRNVLSVSDNEMIAVAQDQDAFLYDHQSNLTHSLQLDSPNTLTCVSFN